MARRLKKRFKLLLVFMIVIALGFGVYCFYNKKDKEVIKEDNKKVDKIKEKVEEPVVVEEPEEEPYMNVLNDGGIFKEYYGIAYNRMINMSLDEKIAQIFLVRVPLYDGINILEQNQFGGYLLFGRDVTNITKDDLIAKLYKYQEVSKIPIIIAIDEEGGSISRIKNNTNIVSEPFLSPMDLYNQGGMDLIESDLRKKNSLLEELGINLNLAPVVDVASEGAFIYNRTLGQDVNTTSLFAETVVRVSKESKVSYTLKHFPGYGNNVDTHKGLAIDNRTLEELEGRDLIPFKRGIDVGAECILVSHNIMTNIEDEIPASLSLKVHNILRNNLNYTGIIVTDDLYMDAIKVYQDKPSIKALLAGNDLIIITDYLEGMNEIKEAINNNEIDIGLLDRAVLRVLAWKYYKGLIQ